MKGSLRGYSTFIPIGIIAGLIVIGLLTDLAKALPWVAVIMLIVLVTGETLRAKESEHECDRDAEESEEGSEGRAG